MKITDSLELHMNWGIWGYARQDNVCQDCAIAHLTKIKMGGGELGYVSGTPKSNIQNTDQKKILLKKQKQKLTAYILLQQNKIKSWQYA